MKHLDDIGARIRDCSTYNFGMHNANKLAYEDAPKMANALRAVLGIHRRTKWEPGHPRPVGALEHGVCGWCGDTYPCLTSATITEALQGEQ